MIFSEDLFVLLEKKSLSFSLFIGISLFFYIIKLTESILINDIDPKLLLLL